MSNFNIKHETLNDITAINILHTKLFGPARFTRAAYLIRENGSENLNFSFTIISDNKLIGSIRITDIFIGILPAFLLGPVAIDNEYHNLGLGSKLIKYCMEKIREAKPPAQLILLIGDFDYYKRFGFKHIDVTNIILPAPADNKRVLAFELCNGASENLSGRIKRC